MRFAQNELSPAVRELLPRLWQIGRAEEHGDATNGAINVDGGAVHDIKKEMRAPGIVSPPARVVLAHISTLGARVVGPKWSIWQGYFAGPTTI